MPLHRFIFSRKMNYFYESCGRNDHSGSVILTTNNKAKEM
jgi:hypothetical protein